MNIQVFGTKKCNDTKKAERFFKERGIKYQFIDMKEKGLMLNHIGTVYHKMNNMRLKNCDRNKTATVFIL